MTRKGNPVATGRSIHIGLNHVDPACYDGWDGELAGCINDANAMKAIADSLGYGSQIMTDAQATSGAVIQAISRAAADLRSGDVLLLTYSGHGGQVGDVNSDEPDAQDETWVLYDRQLIDDELYQLYSQFADSVRILILSDSCHSGTVAKVRTADAYRKRLRGVSGARAPKPDEKPRNLPLEVQAHNEDAQRSLYETVQYLSGPKSGADVRASVLLISGCQDNQLSYDGPGNGRFTAELLTTYGDGAFQGSYAEFHRSILDRMPPDQSPNYFTAGTPYPEFEAQRPFTVASPAGGGGGSSPAPSTPVARPTLRRGDSGSHVTYLQERLVAHGYAVTVDGYFGPKVGSAVQAFQRDEGLVADGIVGPSTWACLERAPASGGGVVEPEPQPQPQPEPQPGPQPEPQPATRPTLRQGDRGEAVKELQILLREQGYSLVADGSFGPFTPSVVRQFQQSCGLVADGIVGPATWNALEAQPAVI
jgi:metacaspase-1